MSAFDVQVKKVQDTWSTKVPWQSGTDGQLLQEFYEVYQKWGMMTLIPAFSAASHIFGQDVHKAALVDTALEEVAALRKAVKEAESKAEETKQTPGGPGQDITKEMVLEKVKENQTLRLQQAQAVVQGMEAEIALPRQGQAIQDFDAALIKAREDRLLCSHALTVGWAGYAEKELQEAMHALTTANTQSLAYLDKLLAPQQKQGNQGTPMTQAEALRLLKIAWNQLVRAVILQNGQKGVGLVKYADTDKTPRGKQALTTLAHDEMSETINMKCMQGESIEEYTCRLQHRERYVRWAISTLLQAGEEAQVLQLADTQFFKLLKVALPQSMLFMGHASFGQGFSALAAGILEATAGTPQVSTPKKVGFAAPALGGRLSRQPGNVINDETRVEEHNKKVTTTYRPKPRQQEEDEQPSSEDEMEAKVRKLMAEVQQLREKKSPTKNQKSADRDGSDAASDGQQQDFERGAQTDVLISLLKDIQGKISDKKVPAKGTSMECYAFSKTGACKFGDKCKYEHSGGTSAPPPYPSSPPKRQRQDSPAPKTRDCFGFLEGYCRKGDQCTYAHNKNSSSSNNNSNNNRPQRPMSTPVLRECAVAKRTGVCGDRQCQDFHGKFDERHKSMCRNIQEGRTCHHQWTPAGCNYNHIPESKQTRRPEHRHEKNGRGSGRADRYRG
jgi:hypothetical protein